MPNNSPTTGSLTADQIASIRQAAGAPPIQQAKGSGSLATSLFSEGASEGVGSLEGKLFSGGITGASAVKDASSVTPESEQGSLLSRVGKDIQGRMGNMSDIAANKDSGKISEGSGILQVAGQAAAGVGDIGLEAAKEADKQLLGGGVAKTLGNIHISPEAIPAPAKALVAALGNLSQKHPEASGDIGAIFNIVSSLYGGGEAGEGAGAISSGLKDAAKGAVDAAAPVVKKGVEATKEVASGVKTINTIAKANKESKAIDSLAGSIVQGKTGDIEKAKTALSSLDPKGIKTYQDLSDALNKKIGNISGKLDETLATKGDTKPLSELDLKSKVGDTEVAHNYVKDAIQQLKDHYKATNDVEALAKVEQLEAKASAEGGGLTIKDINDLAKEHGQELNAFNANGQAASGLTKQAAENTRTGLKSTARELFGDPVYKEVDSQTSALIRTRDLADKMAEEVNKLQQKIKTRTLGEKAGRLAGAVLNVAGLNTPKGFIEYFLSRGTGLKTLNALDLEKALGANLKNLQEALAPGASEATVEAKLQQIIDEAKAKEQ